MRLIDPVFSTKADARNPDLLTRIISLGVVRVQLLGPISSFIPGRIFGLGQVERRFWILRMNHSISRIEKFSYCESLVTLGTVSELGGGSRRIARLR